MQKANLPFCELGSTLSNYGRAQTRIDLELKPAYWPDIQKIFGSLSRRDTRSLARQTGDSINECPGLVNFIYQCARECPRPLSDG